MKSPSLANIRVLQKLVMPVHGNLTLIVKLEDGTTIAAMKQGGMNLWAFEDRTSYRREWLDLFDRRMMELWEEGGDQ